MQREFFSAENYSSCELSDSSSFHCLWAIFYLQVNWILPYCSHFFSYSLNLYSSVQLLSNVQPFETPWTAAHQTSLSITNSQSLLKLMSIEWVMPTNHLILCHPLLLPPYIFPSQQGRFQWVSSSHQVTKVLEFQLEHQSFWWTPRTDFL